MTGAAIITPIDRTGDRKMRYDEWVGDQTDQPADWREEAICSQTSPEAFFPDAGGTTRDAKRICARCTVRVECLDYALANDERFGVWGGLSEQERRKLKRRVQ